MNDAEDLRWNIMAHALTGDEFPFFLHADGEIDHEGKGITPLSTCCWYGIPTQGLALQLKLMGDEVYAQSTIQRAYRKE